MSHTRTHRSQRSAAKHHVKPVAAGAEKSASKLSGAQQKKLQDELFLLGHLSPKVPRTGVLGKESRAALNAVATSTPPEGSEDAAWKLPALPPLPTLKVGEAPSPELVDRVHALVVAKVQASLAAIDGTKEGPFDEKTTRFDAAATGRLGELADEYGLPRPMAQENQPPGDLSSIDSGLLATVLKRGDAAREGYVTEVALDATGDKVKTVRGLDLDLDLNARGPEVQLLETYLSDVGIPVERAEQRTKPAEFVYDAATAKAVVKYAERAGVIEELETLAKSKDIPLLERNNYKELVRDLKAGKTSGPIVRELIREALAVRETQKMMNPPVNVLVDKVFLQDAPLLGSIYQRAETIAALPDKKPEEKAAKIAALKQGFEDLKGAMNPRMAALPDNADSQAIKAEWAKLQGEFDKALAGGETPDKTLAIAADVWDTFQESVDNAISGRLAPMFSALPFESTKAILEEVKKIRSMKPEVVPEEEVNERAGRDEPQAKKDAARKALVQEAKRKHRDPAGITDAEVNERVGKTAPKAKREEARRVLTEEKQKASLEKRHDELKTFHDGPLKGFLDPSHLTIPSGKEAAVKDAVEGFRTRAEKALEAGAGLTLGRLVFKSFVRSLQNRIEDDRASFYAGKEPDPETERQIQLLISQVEGLDGGASGGSGAGWVSEAMIKKIAPGIKGAQLTEYTKKLNDELSVVLDPKMNADVLPKGQKDFTPKQRANIMAIFLANGAHESGGFRYFRELGGPSYFGKMYGHRRDLGIKSKEDAVDGAGQGIVQTTGYPNKGDALGWIRDHKMHLAYGDKVRDLVERAPSIIENRFKSPAARQELRDTFAGLSDPSMWAFATETIFWFKNPGWGNLNQYAMNGTYQKTDKAINGKYPANGQADRNHKRVAILSNFKF